MKRGSRAQVLVRDVSGPAEVAAFRADAAKQGAVLAFEADGEVHALVDPSTTTSTSTTSSTTSTSTTSSTSTSTSTSTTTTTPAPTTTTTPPVGPPQEPGWGFAATNFTAAWSTPVAGRGAGVTVAVLDTGVDAHHPDLQDHFASVPGADFLSGKCVDGTGAVRPTLGVSTDPDGHGTHVTGIIAALDNSIGVVGGAPDTTVVPVRVLDSSGNGVFSDVAAAVLWAADKNGGNAAVLNLSLGAVAPSAVLEACVLRTVESDSAYTHPVIVAASGNGGTSATPSYPARYANYDAGRANPDPVPGLLPVAALCDPGYPSTSADRCLSGAATTVGEAYVLAAFSSRVWIDSHPNAGVAAPGANIISTVPGTPDSYATAYESISGTSMATPMVSAVAALVVAHCHAVDADGHVDSAAVVTRIDTTARNLGNDGGPDQYYGYGRVDAAGAVAGC